MSFNIPCLTEITLDDLEAFGTGAGILGTGNGGNPRLGRLRLQMLLEDDAYLDSVELVDPQDLPPDAAVTSVGGMGAPTISVKKFAGDDGEVQSLRAIEEFSGETADALIPDETGGAGSVAPLCAAAMTNLPVVDADDMGRVLPELQMDTFFIYDTPVNHVATTDKHGNQVVYRDIDSAKRLEDLTRAITIQMGSRSDYAFPLMTSAFVSEYTIPHTISLTAELGRTVERARNVGTDPVDTGHELLGDKGLFIGEIVDARRRSRDGFALGSVTFTGLDENAILEIEFQNEFLVMRDDDDDLRTTVPDLICLVDTDIDAPVTIDTLRYGQRVRVLGVLMPKLLTTPEALDTIGLEALGYEAPYDPLPWDETGW